MKETEKDFSAEGMTLWNGDCFELIKDIPDKSVDCIITDPPYLYISGGCKGRPTNKKITETLGNFGKNEIHSFLNLAVPKLKKINMYVFCSRLQIPIYLDYVQENNYKFDVLIWNKNNHCVKNSQVFCEDIEYVIRIYDKGVLLNKIYNSEGKLESRYYCKLKSYKQPKIQHLTPKPVELIEEFLLVSTNPGETVLDCFMGSGSTGIACRNTGRNFIGIEKQEDYFQIAKSRIQSL